MTTAEMELWVRAAGLPWQEPHFVHDIDGIKSWEWWKDDRYLTAGVYSDGSPSDCALYADAANVVASVDRPLDRCGFIELYRGLLGVSPAVAED